MLLIPFGHLILLNLYNSRHFIYWAHGHSFSVILKHKNKSTGQDKISEYDDLKHLFFRVLFA